jgi:hypothetical protein
MAYSPPAASTGLLGSVIDLLKSATPLTKPTGCNFIATLPNGSLFFESKLWIDTDGSGFHRPKVAAVMGTSLLNDDGSGINANTISYMVLPTAVANQAGIALGDFAVVIRGVRVVPAIFADTGPANIIGEASIAVHRALGNDPINAKGEFLDNGLEATERVLTIVFPGSGNGKARAANDISASGNLLFLVLRNMSLVQSVGAAVNNVRSVLRRF